MDEDDLEAFEQREVREDERRERDDREERERAALAAKEQQLRAVIGHDWEGRPVYDDDPHMTANCSD